MLTEATTLSDSAIQYVDDGCVVCLDHAWQRRNWARWLNCTESELATAVETAGTDPDNVRRFLRQAR